MKFTVQYRRYFEEFGWEDVDEKVFDTLSEAYQFYNANIENEAQLWQGVVGDDNFSRIH